MEGSVGGETGVGKTRVIRVGSRRGREGQLFC